MLLQESAPSILAETPTDRELALLQSPIAITPGLLREKYADKLLTGEVTEEHLAVLGWLVKLGREKNLTMSALGRLVEINDGTISKLFSGSYPAKLDSLCARIEAFRELWEQRQAINKASFVPTSITKIMWEACDTALLYQTIFPVYGESQLGKTTALEEYERRDRFGRVHYVRMPAEGHLGEFLIALNTALFESTKTSSTRLRSRPMEVIKSSHLVLIDEIHQTTLVPGRGSARVNTIEYIRELWDKTQCGMVLAGTNSFRNEVESGQHKKMLEQLRRRGLPPIQLPDMLPREDMDAIAKAFGLPKADDDTHEIRRKIIATAGLRAYTNFLKGGSKLAEKFKQRMEWKYFVSAHDILAKLSVKQEEGK